MGRQLLGLREYAEHRSRNGMVGTTLRAVQKAIASGRISTIPDEKGRARIDPTVADIQWSRNTDADQSGRANAARLAAGDARAAGADSGQAPAEGSGTSPYWEAKTRREQAEARRAELETAKLEKELVNLAEARRAAFDAGRMLRDLILAVPQKLAAELASVTDPVVIERRIREELRRPLEQVSKMVDSEGAA